MSSGRETELGTMSSGGEADVNSQYEATNKLTGMSRTSTDGSSGHVSRAQRAALHPGNAGELAKRQTTVASRIALIMTAAIAAALAFALAPSAAQAQQRIALANAAHTATIRVTIGKSEDIKLTDQSTSIADITIGNPDVADVNPLTDQKLSILGKKAGTTRVTLYGEDKKLVGVFDVEVTYDTSQLNAEIAHLSGGGIRVLSANGHILLSGKVSDAVTLDKVVMMARQFDPNLINTVQVMQPQQIMLEVRFIEVSRQASRELGVQWNMFGNRNIANIGDQVPANQLPVTPGGLNVSPSASTVSPVVAAGVLSGSAPFGFLVSQLVGGKNSLDVSLNALEQKGLARSLANPNLVALSGDTASFLAGGEIPVPQVSATGTPSFGYQPYGVGLSFTPTVLRDGLINLVIKPEVSEIDTSTTVTIAGASVPGLIVRRASTTLELRDSQSFMLGGLLQNTNSSAVDQLPWVGDVPVLGALFRSAQYQKKETDLVIIVTPHVIKPLPPSAPIHTPLDDSLPANDVDFFLMGQAEVSPALARLAIGALSRPYVGHILDLPKNGANYVAVKN
jgi:pilus assembly protein CpaC